MDDESINKCPKCGSNMNEISGELIVGPGSATPTIEGTYLLCPSCGYAKPKHAIYE